MEGERRRSQSFVMNGNDDRGKFSPMSRASRTGISVLVLFADVCVCVCVCVCSYSVLCTCASFSPLSFTSRVSVTSFDHIFFCLCRHTVQQSRHTHVFILLLLCNFLRSDLIAILLCISRESDVSVYEPPFASFASRSLVSPSG